MAKLSSYTETDPSVLAKLCSYTETDPSVLLYLFVFTKTEPSGSTLRLPLFVQGGCFAPFAYLLRKRRHGSATLAQ